MKLFSAIQVTRFVNSRSMVALAGILMLIAARMAFQQDEITYFTSDRGILFQSANLWISNHWLTMAVNTALILATALSWMFIIQVFNPFRALTTLPASFFVIMILAVPDLMDQFFTGTLMAAIMPGCLALLWSTFENRFKLQHIFLIFTILSALTMTQYCFAVYIPVFIIGCAQMKIFSLRTVLAIIFGLVTPWWIMMGLGIIDSSAIHPPTMANSFAGSDFDGVVNLVLVSVTTVLLLIAAWGANFMKVVALNANLRAYNGSISMIALFTLIAMLADFTNAAAYLPTLMLVTSYQLSYTFSVVPSNRRFIPVLVIMTIYIAFYIIRMLI